MSLAAAKDFLNSIDANRTEVSKLMDAFNYETGQWDGEALVAYGKEQGFDFTADEVKTAGEDLFGDELTDEQLEYVSGGACCCCSSSSCCGVAAN
ncbi:MAG: Nif11-like leader peptide family natural product precursor [Chloroflexi bacterium]|nr:Nif11-like leader peptide family natural product precursor [Chloroflexota bacterium]